jgi:hypothetical protein
MGCLTGVVFGSMIWIAYADMPLLAVVGGGISAVIFALLVRLVIQILGFSNRQIVCVKRRRWDWRKAGIGLIIGIVFVIIISVISDIARSMFFEGLGLTAALQETISFNTVVWWNWGLPGLLSLSAFFLLIFGLGWGDVVLREEVDLPNQGVKDSGWNGLMVAFGGLLAGIAFSLAIGLPCYLGFGYKSSTGICYGGDPAALLSGLRLGLGYGLILGFIFGMTLGGFAWMRHYLVRVLFCLDRGQIPWRLVSFLQYCSRLGFLRSVGGGFEFIDQELKAHFARAGADE